MKAPSVHGDIDTGRECLDKGKCTAEIEQTVRAMKLVRNDRSSEHNGLVFDLVGKDPGSHLHSVRTMCDDDSVLPGLSTLLDNEMTIGVRDVKAVNHHQRPDVDLDLASAQRQHLREVGIFEIQRAFEFVVLFVECAACDKNPDRHSNGPRIFLMTRYTAWTGLANEIKLSALEYHVSPLDIEHATYLVMTIKNGSIFR